MTSPFLRPTREDPGGPAVWDPHRGLRLSHSELERLVHRWAGWLTARGIQPGSTVASLMEKHPRTVAAAHAVWALGAALAPLHRRESEEELRRRLRLLNPDALLIDSRTNDPVPGGASLPVLHADATPGAAPPDDIEPLSWDPPAPRSDRPALVLFTSGTSGTARGVVLSIDNLRCSARASDARLGHVPSDRWLDPLPLYHMGGLAPIIRCARQGSTLVLVPPGEPAAGDVLRRHRITGLSLVPTQLRDALDAGARLDRGSLRFVLTGGDATPPDLIRRCEHRGVPVHPTYGMTETASQVATACPPEVFRDPSTVGRPLRGTTVTILDGNGEPAAPGETGAITVRGPTVMQGYLRPEGSLDSSPVEPDGFRTGDRGYLDENGRLHVEGRSSDRIVSGGENVDAREVRGVLRRHPAVRDAAVIGLEDPRWGQRVAALLEPAVEEPPDVELIRSHCRKRLADFKRPRPLAWARRLPRTPSGTVDRPRVRKRLREVPSEDG